jgi:RHS repeat-associated protein
MKGSPILSVQKILAENRTNDKSPTDTYEYDGFGNQINSTGSTPNSYLYRGEAYDSDLGLYYLRARYYNPLTGRFMSRDPEEGNIYDPKILHKFLYARQSDRGPADVLWKKRMMIQGCC